MVKILSAFELARRHLPRETIKIESAADVLPLLADIANKSQEHFICISVNGASELIEKRMKTQDQLVPAAKILGIRVLDHLIVSKKGYFSFQEAGLIE